MNESSAAGNPSAASSHSLPVNTNKDMLKKPDWISASEEAAGQNRESVSLSESQKHQSPVETKQTAEEHHEDPSSQEQKPEDSPTKPDQLKPEEPSAAEPDPTKLNPLPAEQQRLGGSPSTGNKDTKDSPEDQPKPDQPPPNGADAYCTDKKTPGDSEPDNSQERRNQQDICPANHLNSEQALPPSPPPPSKDSVFTSTFEEQKKELVLHICESKDQQNHQDPPPENRTLTANHQDPPPENRTLTANHQDPPPENRTLTTNHQDPPPENRTLTTNHQDPPPENRTLTTNHQKAHPPPVDEQNHPSSSQVLSSVVNPTKVPTLAPPSQTPPLTLEVFCDQVKCRPPGFSKGEPKLCGFLLKQGGPLKAWKLRWFTYEDKKNQLFYYRTPQDVTPLGRVELCSATFTYPLKAEGGTFHIKTPERTFILKAVTQELMLYWLQQLQVKRWQHRQTTTCPDPTNNNNTADDFLPVLKSPLGLVGEEAANVPSQRTPLANMSIKHPFIEIHRRRRKNLSSSTMQVLRRDSSSSDRVSRLQQEKQMLMEEVKAQKELVWILHKALEASQLEKRTCAEFLAETGEQERLELLRHRERQAADLRGRLEEAKVEAEALRRSLAQREAQLAELQENIRMLTEKNNAKQEVIIKLSDQVTACMSDPRRSISSSCGGLDSQTFRQLQQETENLKDDIEAYKTQNKFLNSELYQLTKLWRNSSEQEKSLMMKCAYLEATNCQVESRYLGVLRQLQDTKSLDPVQRGTIQKLIEDALKGELKSAVKLNLARDHDAYGFKIIPDYEEGVERPLLSRWAQYLAGRSDNDLCPSPELKGLLRGGVPQEYRQRVWRWMVRTRTRTIREHHPQRYQQLCEKSRTSPHSVSRQIQLDLHRTLTTNQHFSSPSSPALQQLRRVLLAFSWQNPAIGYCQGLNRLAAIALLVLQSEEDAFWCLVTVVETIMPQDYYTKNLVASQADQRVLKDFLSEKLPRLAVHFEDHSIDVSLITFNWFLVVFVESLPSDILLPLWDAFLYEGTKVIYRYALALFKYKEDDILKIHDSVEIYQYLLRFFTKTISDGRKLTSIAFNDLNPFPGRLLRNRRVLHLDRLQGELRELEEQQRISDSDEEQATVCKDLRGDTQQTAMTCKTRTRPPDESDPIRSIEWIGCIVNMLAAHPSASLSDL
ncbi:TBC1 domain family member 2A [Collichthys lucidus]|uniref:TBC1 domain family member 2A n=1 Tax=Collichthys lucidus TaxID=240159 RepID=A0A4V6APA3_COLLU|nr:TBC1 domain family member 2A [Collichthys lucidus]